MPVVISDETLREAGLTEREAVVEFACHLFDAGKLALWPAAKVAGLSRSEFERELGQRKIAVYRPTVNELREDLEKCSTAWDSDRGGRGERHVSHPGIGPSRPYRLASGAVLRGRDSSRGRG